MEGYHSPQVEVEVRLNTNEAPEPPPAEFTERLAAQLGGLDWHRYPDRAASALRARVAEVEGAVASQVFAANGSNEVLQTLCLTYGGQNRVCLTFEPTYALHAHIARLCGTEVVEEQRRDDFTLDIDHAVTAVRHHRPTITFLCSPNNPTGRVEPREVVEAVLGAVGAVDGLLVVDEAYGQFAPWSALELIDEDRPLVVTRTFSKTWSMAAARLGYLIGPSWVVSELEKVVLPYHLDAVKQAAGVVALDYIAEMHARVAALVEERGRVETALDDLGVGHWPSGANFILFRVPDEPGTKVWQRLLDESVLVRNCASWPRLDDCLRVTLGTPEENDRFLAALGRIVKGDGP
ncbi:MAG: histidinol-phosphate transaminase [Microthrixaceae bacterium]|nr:histidinol-phosphate transaminase [Microthrixaceae bacterium]